MENRKRNIQMKFYVTEEEKRLIDEKMKQLPIKQYGAYFRKMAIDGYILVVDRSDTKAYIRELQAVSRNINQIAKRANATGTVYRQDIEDIKKAVDEIWRLQRRTLRQAGEGCLYASSDPGGGSETDRVGRPAQGDPFRKDERTAVRPVHQPEKHLGAAAGDQPCAEGAGRHAPQERRIERPV